MAREIRTLIKPVPEVRRRPEFSRARSGSSAYLRDRLGGSWIVLSMLLLTGITPSARAEEIGIDNPGEIHTQLDSDETHPIYATSSAWVVSFLIGSAGLFLAAAVIGPVVRAEVPDAVPAAMSHEEDPGVDRH